jgi:hypothetical protein
MTSDNVRQAKLGQANSKRTFGADFVLQAPIRSKRKHRRIRNATSDNAWQTKLGQVLFHAEDGQKSH